MSFSFSRLVKLYNIVLIPLAIVLFIALYVFIKARNMPGVYVTSTLIALSPFVAYCITKKIANI